MRRSFKDHLRAYCNARGYSWCDTEEDGRWIMRVDHFIKIFNDSHQKNTYVLVDNISGIRCTAVASAWDIMCDVLGELMSDHLKKCQESGHGYCLIVDK